MAVTGESHLLFAARPAGGHVDVEVRAGPRGADRALCGVLVMRPEEWATLRALLETDRRVGQDWTRLVEIRETETP